MGQLREDKMDQSREDKIDQAREDKTEYKKDLIRIHGAVLLFGLSGLFAKYIRHPAPVIALGRVVFSSAFLFVMLKIKGVDIKLREKKQYWQMAIVGVVLAVHWTTFFMSAQVSTVAIATLTFSTFPVFITFLEPYFFKEKLLVGDVVCAFVMLMGVLCIVPKFELGNTMTQGVVWGMIGSFTYAVMSLANRGFVKEYEGTVVAFYEQLAAAVVMLPLLFVYRPVFSIMDILLLLLLGIVFTGIAHSLFINGMKTIKAQTAGIISGLESVYGILAAAILLAEIPGIREILGGILILGVVFYSTKKVRH